MGNIREQVIEEIVNMDLFHTYQIIKGEKVPTYVIEGYDKEKMEAEGSIWIVYVYWAMSDYYQKHKDEIDKEANRILRANIK
jgi:hypothetical protein